MTIVAPPNDETQVRTAEEIQRAHDLIEGIVLGEAPDLFQIMPADLQERLVTTLSTLCWSTHEGRSSECSELESRGSRRERGGRKTD
jgi:hypothetical protein